MAIHDIYSKRKKRLAGEVRDVYTYDEIPGSLRNQVVFITEDIIRLAFGSGLDLFAYNYISSSLCREWGTDKLGPNSVRYSGSQELAAAIRGVKDTDRFLDIVEFTFQYVGNKVETDAVNIKRKDLLVFQRHVEELNYRFKENGVGYEYSNSQIVRIDSQLIHAEVVKPAISLLSESGFEGAQDEFLSAHEHFRHQRYKEALNEALKSFESTIKVVASRRGWAIKKSDTANKLVKACMDNGLIPSYYECHFSALTNLLAAGVPSIRNAEAGHGQGAVVKEIDPHVVAYTLHMTASAIVLFVQSYKALPEEPEKPNE